MEHMKPGAIVGAGMLTIFDLMDVKTPQRGADTPFYLSTKELRDSCSLSDQHSKRIIEIITDVISKERSHMFVGRRSGPAYFSDKSSCEVLSGQDLGKLVVSFDKSSYDPESLEFVPSKIEKFIANKTSPICVTCGTLKERIGIAEKLNSMFAPKSETVFEALHPGREAYFIVEKIFDVNKPLLTGGFSVHENDDVSCFLVISVGCSTIHWVVYDDYKHYVAMCKAKSVSPWAYKYICMNYNPLSEDDRIQIALNTQEAISAWKALRSS